MGFWSSERDALAREYWRMGRTAREIVGLIGAPSVAAVTSRLWRMGAERPGAVKPARRSAAGPQGLRAWPLPTPSDVACNPRPWLEREDHECAYPVAGEGVGVLSCCNPVARGEYCAGHDAAVHQRRAG